MFIGTQSSKLGTKEMLEPICLAGTSMDQSLEGEISEAPCQSNKVLCHLIDLYLNMSYEYENKSNCPLFFLYLGTVNVPE